MLFPGRLDDIPVRVAELDADVFGLIPLLDEFDAVTQQLIAQCQHGLAVVQADSEVHPGRTRTGSVVGRSASAKPTSLYSIRTPSSYCRGGLAPKPRYVS